MFRGSLDLHKFSEDALPERILEIADSTMWMHKDAYNSTTRSRIGNCLEYPARRNNLERGSSYRMQPLRCMLSEIRTSSLPDLMWCME
jgi:hypothetical protein